MFEIKLKPEVKKASEAGGSGSSAGTPRKETVYAKMVSLRRRTTSGDLKKSFFKQLSISKTSAAASERPRVQSESGMAAASTSVDPPSSTDKKQSHGGQKKSSSTLKITDLKDFNKLSPTSATAAASMSGTSPAASNSSSVNSIPKEVSPDDPFDNIGKKHALK